ncbi:alanine racemase [Nocardioides silvaticus]|uniref:Alanine racemase n=1 Tax=Nocardioides silvaticus TaxID=2201891 RepID=A0A316TAY9_9ACTN|nr:alanine racemase [Nocardioides silvaticus]PWN00898.1 alanine racemase [Nocardioides silvaticus]
MTEPSGTAGTQPTLLIDPSAVTANVRTIGAATTGEVMAVVKAEGFGHGTVAVAHASLAGGATRFGVTNLEEAFALRDAGFTERILSWLNPLDADFATAAERDIEIAVPGLAHLDVVRAAPGLRVHLQLDTGMARDGASPEEWVAMCREARSAEEAGVLSVVGVMGHLACADRPGDPANEAGRDRFAWGLRTAQELGLTPTDHHLAATAATLSDPLTHHTMSRIGAGLVGINEARNVALRPALTLTAPLVQVRRIAAGTSVGYGHSWTAPRDTRLGLLGLGYADGLPRLASNRAQVMVRGRRYPVVGRISMDMTIVDLGPEDGAVRQGDLATVFGPGDAGEPTAAEWAGWAETLEHEIVTGLGPRLHRTTLPLAAAPATDPDPIQIGTR